MVENKIPPEIAWLFVAVFGGIAKFFDSYLKGEERMHVVRFLALMIVSGFSGYMTASLMDLHNPKWDMVAAGVGGFAGTRTIEMVLDAVNNRFGLKKKDEPKP